MMIQLLLLKLLERHRLEKLKSPIINPSLKIKKKSWKVKKIYLKKQQLMSQKERVCLIMEMMMK